MDETRETHALTPIRWRSGAPPGRSGSLYQFVREYLWRAGGSCTRAELLTAILENEAVRTRLGTSQGFTALLSNMRHSGELMYDGEIIRATARALRRGAPLDGAANIDPTRA